MWLHSDWLHVSTHLSFFMLLLSVYVCWYRLKLCWSEIGFTFTVSRFNQCFDILMLVNTACCLELLEKSLNVSMLHRCLLLVLVLVTEFNSDRVEILWPSQNVVFLKQWVYYYSEDLFKKLTVQVKKPWNRSIKRKSEQEELHILLLVVILLTIDSSVLEALVLCRVWVYMYQLADNLLLLHSHWITLCDWQEAEPLGIVL